MCFPTCPMSPDNEIDMLPPYLTYPGTQPNTPVQPAVPVMAPVANPVVPAETPVVPVEQPVPTI